MLGFLCKHMLHKHILFFMMLFIQMQLSGINYSIQMTYKKQQWTTMNIWHGGKDYLTRHNFVKRTMKVIHSQMILIMKFGLENGLWLQMSVPSGSADSMMLIFKINFLANKSNALILTCLKISILLSIGVLNIQGLLVLGIKNKLESILDYVMMIRNILDLNRFRKLENV